MIGADICVFQCCYCCSRLILETDPATIASRVAMRGPDDNLSLTEQVNVLSTCISVVPADSHA